MDKYKRREFLKQSGGFTLPFFLSSPVSRTIASWEDTGKKPVSFVTDAILPSPPEYLSELQLVLKDQKNPQDFYGSGGAVKELEQKFATHAGKERAIFLPTGTMANNVAIRILSGGNIKVIVQETSHIYRDEADAAQAIHSKRLLPIAPEKGAFTLADLEAAIEYHKKGEVFRSPVGVLSIEIPVRRADNHVFPFDELKKISAYCRNNNIKLHLDGARIHIASAYSGISIKDYSSLFDTVYFSLYKYLGSPGGAILCGDAAVIDQVSNWIKILGGSIFQGWPYAAIPLKKLDTFEEQFKKARAKADELFRDLSATGLMDVKRFDNGSNVHQLFLSAKVDSQKMSEYLHKEHNIFLRAQGPQGFIRVFVNESILSRDNKDIVAAMTKAIQYAKV